MVEANRITGSEAKALALIVCGDASMNEAEPFSWTLKEIGSTLFVRRFPAATKMYAFVSISKEPPSPETFKIILADPNGTVLFDESLSVLTWNEAKTHEYAMALTIPLVTPGRYPLQLIAEDGTLLMERMVNVQALA